MLNIKINKKTKTEKKTSSMTVFQLSIKKVHQYYLHKTKNIFYIDKFIRISEFFMTLTQVIFTA